MLLSASSLILIAGLFEAAAVGASPVVARDGTSPSLPYDANASKYCSWWIDLTVSTPCPLFLARNFITLEEFRRWNPSITADCTNLDVGNAYCVEVMNEPAPAPTSATQTSTVSTTLTSLISTSTTSTPALTTASSTTTSASSVTTTTAGNGIQTPQPTQPSMVTNCNKFHWVAKGVVCSQITSYNKITLANFVTWNPTVGSDCTRMQADVYVCVGIIGGPTTTDKPTTTTTVGNGIQTPQPTQPSMVTNCNKFHWVAKGVVCSQITSYNKITLANFVAWNPTVGSDCTRMQADVYVCVGVIGGPTTVDKPTTTTTAGNGIQTPQPTQPGMVTNCKKFHYVAEGVVCSQITSYNKISLADFVKWNSGIGADCRNMWAKTYVCVGV